MKSLVDTHEHDGTPLNDSFYSHIAEEQRFEEDRKDTYCTDQLTQVVTLEYLEARDSQDRFLQL